LQELKSENKYNVLSIGEVKRSNLNIHISNALFYKLVPTETNFFNILIIPDILWNYHQEMIQTKLFIENTQFSINMTEEVKYIQ
jgi:hypothetical protein